MEQIRQLRRRQPLSRECHVCGVAVIDDAVVVHDRELAVFGAQILDEAARLIGAFRFDVAGRKAPNGRRGLAHVDQSRGGAKQGVGPSCVEIQDHVGGNDVVQPQRRDDRLRREIHGLIGILVAEGGIVRGSRAGFDNPPHVSIECLGPLVEHLEQQRGRLEHPRDDIPADRLVLVKDWSRIRHELDLRRVERRGRRLLTALRAVGTADVARADGRRLSYCWRRHEENEQTGRQYSAHAGHPCQFRALEEARNLRRSGPAPTKYDDVARMCNRVVPP